MDSFFSTKDFPLLALLIWSMSSSIMFITLSLQTVSRIQSVLNKHLVFTVGTRVLVCLFNTRTCTPLTYSTLLLYLWTMDLVRRDYKRYEFYASVHILVAICHAFSFVAMTSHTVLLEHEKCETSYIVRIIQLG